MRSSTTRPALSLLDAANWIAGSLCVALMVVFLWTRAFAASPTSGTITPTGPAVTFTGTVDGTGAAQGESTCVDGVNCDTFTLTVAPGTYTNKTILVKIAWNIPADDYDLYVHKSTVSGTLIGSSANGAPSTSEQVTIDPNVTGPGTYVIHVVYFTTASAADEYVGTAALQSKPVSANRTATYVYTGADGKPVFGFANDTPLKGPVTSSDGEPSSRADAYGNYYSSGIRGFPAGVDLWYFDLRPTVTDTAGNTVANPTYDPLMKYPLYRGQPDAFVGYNANLQQTGVNLGGDGGGDIDLAVGFGPGADVLGSPTPPTLAYASLIAANLSSGKSSDTGKTFQQNPGGNVPGGVAGDDRQWLEFYGSKSVYMLYRTLEPAITQIQRSDDGGLTYGVASTTGLTGSDVASVGMIGQTGGIDVDPTDGAVFVSGSNGVVGVGIPEKNPVTHQAILDPVTNTPAAPVRYSVYQAATDPNGVAHLFFQVAVAKDSGNGAGKNGKPYGTVYCLYSNDRGIFLENSLTRGKTWSKPVQVNGPGLGTNINIFPRMALGKAYGSVGIVWYGTTDSTINGAFIGSQKAIWRAFYAQTYDAQATTPAFQEAAASDHYIHSGNISEGGLVVSGPSPNRNLLDYFEIAFDPTGAAVISYTDDHNDFNGDCYATRQIRGPSIGGTTPAGVTLKPGDPLPTFAEGPKANRTLDNFTSPPVVPATDGSQVTDYAQDQSSGLVATTPTNSSADITAIRYYAVGGTALAATMRVSDLNNNGVGAPIGSYWRMCFTANAPNAVLDPTRTYSEGLSDLGDQFYLEAAKGTNNAITYSYGTVTRGLDGSLTYSAALGTATGSFNPSGNTITVQVPLAGLNAILTTAGRPLLKSGSVLCGLRGIAVGSESGAILEDETYGGTQYTLP